MSQFTEWVKQQKKRGIRRQALKKALIQREYSPDAISLVDDIYSHKKVYYAIGFFIVCVIAVYFIVYLATPKYAYINDAEFGSVSNGFRTLSGTLISYNDYEIVLQSQSGKKMRIESLNPLQNSKIFFAYNPSQATFEDLSNAKTVVLLARDNDLPPLNITRIGITSGNYDLEFSFSTLNPLFVPPYD